MVTDGTHIIPVHKAALVNLDKLFWIQLLLYLLNCVIGMIAKGRRVNVQEIAVFFQIHNILCQYIKGLSVPLDKKGVGIVRHLHLQIEYRKQLIQQFLQVRK